jgi:hypothetical protein
MVWEVVCAGRSWPANARSGGEQRIDALGLSVERRLSAPAEHVRARGATTSAEEVWC